MYTCIQRLPLSFCALILSTSLVAPAIFAQDTSNATDGSPQDASNAIPNLKLYPGVEATLFASEPLMLSPTNMDVDEKGRVWVCEVVNYRAHAEDNLRPEGDRILILEDEDGDGVADTSKVYYQGRDIDSAQGIAVLGNKVIVTAAPYVFIFTDEDGDDKPDKKELLFDRAGRPQDDHGTHSMLFGPDGKLYWNMGNGGTYIHDKNRELVIDKAGNPVFAKGRSDDVEAVYYGGMVFRCNLDGSDFEVLGHNFRNNYEATVDSLGTIWQSDNDDDGNRGCRLNFIMEYGNYGYRDELTGAGWAQPRTGWSDDISTRHWHQNDPGVVPNFVQYGAGSPTGITAYEGRLLPEIFWDQVLHCEAGPGVVWAPVAAKNGAGYDGNLVALMQTDQDKWVRPVDVAVAPDGAVFVSDWYDPVVGWNRQEDTARGRIFRIAPPGHVSSAPKYDFDSAKGAAEALKSPNYAARYLAWTALHAMGTGAEAALENLYASDNTRFRARALWLLSKIEGRGGQHIEEALSDPEEDIRVVAVRAARQRDADIVPIIKALVHDESAQVRRECLIALRESESAEAAELWAELALQHDGEDRWYLEALGIAAEDRWDDALAVWLAKVGDNWNTPAGRDIIWRSRARDTPMYLAGIVNSNAVEADEVSRYLRAFDYQPENSERTQSLRALVFDARDKNSAKYVAAASEALLRLDDFDIHADEETEKTINGLLDAAAGTDYFARVVQRFELREHYSELMRFAVANRDTPAGVSAVRALLQADASEVVAAAIHDEDSEAASLAIETVGLARNDSANDALVEVLLNENLDWNPREQAVRALARNGDGGNTLVRLAEQGRFPKELSEIAGMALTRTMNVALKNRSAELFPLPPMKNSEPLPQMTELLVYTGDAARGKEMFVTATCSTCHVVKGEGTNFGPDLSEIGSKLPKRGLYESIFDPSSGISPTYKPYLIELADGELITGFVETETDEVVSIRLEGGVLAQYERSEVVEMTPQTVSAMPTGLHQTMTINELVDLVEYLSTLETPAAL